MDNQIEEIKNKLDILEIVGGYVKLTKTGVNNRGNCPFHKEKTPSFFVNPSRQIWHCFGCGKGGDVFEFVKEIEGVEFGDALRLLAKKAGVELKRGDFAQDQKIKTERQRLYEIMELSCKFFQKQLADSPTGKEAKDYLLKRGILQASIEKWKLGYSPDTWNSLSDFLISQGYLREEIIKAGLAIAKDFSSNNHAARNDSYDRFRGRIIFPIFDLNSQVVGFGARIFKTKDAQEVAKYINTPQTLLYDKSNLLYGLNFAKLTARKENKIVLTEGYTDTIMCHQSGFENTVATSGTALTQRQLDILKRYTDNLILSFDTDSAGQNATTRGIDLAQEKGFNIKIIDVYEAKDPAEIIAGNPPAGGIEVWKSILEKAKPIVDYYFDSAFLKFDKSLPEGKREIAKSVLPVIKRVENNIERSFWVQKLSQKLDIKEEVILSEMAKISLPNQSSQNSRFQSHNEVSQNNGIDRKKLIEDKIIALVFKNPEDCGLIDEKCQEYFSEKTKNLLQKIKNKEQDPEIKSFLDILSLKQEVQYEDQSEEEVSLCLAELKTLELKRKINQISQQIKIAEQEGNLQKIQELMAELNMVSKEL